MVERGQDLESGLCVTNCIRIVTISDTHFGELKSVKDFFLVEWAWICGIKIDLV